MNAENPARTDLFAGLVVALVGLPQCLAYAMMSGLPPVYGITTAAVPGLVAALVGRSAQVTTGPTNTTGLLILSALVPFLGTNGIVQAEGMHAVATLTLLAGVFRLVTALAGGAALVRFLPESVLVGFTAGAGVLIASMQIDEALGLPPVSQALFFGELRAVVDYGRDAVFPSIPAVLMTAFMVLALSMGKRIFPRGPMALAVLTAVSAAAWAFGWSAANGLPLASDRAPMPDGRWPDWALPELSSGLLHQFFVPSLAITLLGTLELAVSARARGARPDMRREILAQGWANVAGAFTASFPASASLTRSALLRLAGARTRLASAAAAVFMIPILLVFGPSIAYVPQAALAGILFVTAFDMIDWRSIARMWRATPATRLLLVATLASTLLLPLEWAILLGAGLGLVIHLARTSVPRLRLLIPTGADFDRLLPLKPEDNPETVVVEVSGDLHYAAVDPFLAELEHRIPRAAKVVVMDLSHAHEMRFTALVALERFASDLAGKGIAFHLSGAPDDVMGMIEASRSHLPATPAEPEPHLSLRKCLRRIEAQRTEAVTRESAR
ncbi:MAG TPA: solute carrier family 23 protein [Vicinamibacteria bacterium]|nr:solute carrier family 23 protein [Vicinamibacteria bacterium]